MCHASLFARARHVRARHLAPVLGMLATAAVGPAPAASGTELIEMINDYRQSSAECEGQPVRRRGPLAPSEALARIHLGEGSEWQQALRRVGYQAAKAQAITLNGPGDAQAVMQVLERRYCRAVLDPQYAVIGVSREGHRWEVVLARPLLSAELGDWQQAGRAVLAQVNEARAEPRRCGDTAYQAAPPVSWEPALAQSALRHSRDMARRNYFRHLAPEGTHAGNRARLAGYQWRRIGENIASGQSTPDQVVAGWLASPLHCENLMNPVFTQMGAAYATDPDSDGLIYWSQVFGTPR